MAYSLGFTHAISIVVYIAVKMNYENSAQYLSTKSISEKMGIPVPTLNKVLRSLILSGILISKEGAKGGLMIAREPAKITLLDIFTAIEQEQPLFKPVTGLNIHSGEVEHFRNNIDGSLQSAERSMKQSLSKVTIKQLMS